MEGPARFIAAILVILAVTGPIILAARATCTKDGWRCLDQGSIVNGGRK